MTTNTLHKFLDEINTNFSFEQNPKIAVAVSGGADSMSLMLLLREWAKLTEAKLICLTVNHNLRIEAENEAQYVHNIAKQFNLEHHILSCNLQKRTNLQSKARDARIGMLTKWCHDNKVRHLFLAHNLNDLVETFFMRLFRGSGVRGLASIEALNIINNIRIIRPLLRFPRYELEDFLRTQNITWINDPSNQNDLFMRSRVRKLLASEMMSNIIPKDLLFERCAEAIAHLKKTDALFEAITTEYLVKIATIYPEGYLTIKLPDLLQLDKEIALNFLSACLITISGDHHYRPRMVSLNNLYRTLLKGDKKDKTLWQCHIITKKNLLYICKEMSDDHLVELIDKDQIKWDNRFLISYPNLQQKVQIERFTQIKLLQDTNFDHQKLKSLPRKVLYTLPFLRIEDKPYVFGLTINKINNLNIQFRPTIPLAKNSFRY